MSSQNSPVPNQQARNTRNNSNNSNNNSNNSSNGSNGSNNASDSNATADTDDVPIRTIFQVSHSMVLSAIENYRNNFKIARDVPWAKIDYPPSDWLKLAAFHVDLRDIISAEIIPGIDAQNARRMAWIMQRNNARADAEMARSKAATQSKQPESQQLKSEASSSTPAPVTTPRLNQSVHATQLPSYAKQAAKPAAPTPAPAKPSSPDHRHHETAQEVARGFSE
ncbi:hypothetical protein EKO04_010304 [Ascochyta lentis]|uniref:Uncharacterized protein n=1 Tax=Ascochyta lentis TaxID=205686 RepID=A0A8H7IV87_9PLEO|nr:hypothetical protein EKO04_010304 [Ascochyta lentis]